MTAETDKIISDSLRQEIGMRLSALDSNSARRKYLDESRDRISNLRIEIAEPVNKWMVTIEGLMADTSL